jgi:hypothetical protein
MAKSDTNIMHFDVTPDKLMEVLVNTDYQADREKATGALEVEIKKVKHDDDEAVYAAHTKEYSRGVTGIDKSKTENSVTTYTWDLKNKTGFYKYVGPHGDRVRVRGDLTIEPDGDNSKLTIVFNIEVKIPLLGGKVENMVMKNVAKRWADYEKAIRDWCGKL